MTATLSPLPPPRRPARSGEPWTPEDYETLVRMSAEGAGLPDVAQTLERRDTAVLARARRMLPLDERGLPADRALVQLGSHLRDDPAYDWARWLATSPPPPPVQHTHVTVRRDGIPGLEDEDLLAVAECLVTGGGLGSPTRQDLLREVAARGLTARLATQVGEHLVDAALRPCGLPVRPPADPYPDAGPPWEPYPDAGPFDPYPEVGPYPDAGPSWDA